MNGGFKNMENFDHKIYKFMNKNSAIDVTPNLEFRKTDKNGENVYKGSIKFAINDKKNGYAYAYIDKMKAKMVLKSIVEDKFNRYYPAELYPNGFVDFGGTPKGKNGEPESRIIKIGKGLREVKDKDKNVIGKEEQYVFTISKGKGRVTSSGAIQMVGQPEKTVQTYLPFHEALQMAGEVLDYILTAEAYAYSKGEALCTWVPKFQPESTGEKNQIENQEDGNVEEQEFVFSKGKFAGKKVSDLTNEELKALFNTIRQEPKFKKLLILAKKEINKRMSQ
jgi:hypothetical protein